MPKWLERRLEKQADKKGLTGKKKSAYVHSTLRKIENGKKSNRRSGSR